MTFTRFTNFEDFGRLLGLYAAEGTKSKGALSFGNCNAEIIDEYRSLLKSILSARIYEYKVDRPGNRQTMFVIRAGGVCAKRLILNGMNATLNYLASPGDLSEVDKKLALKFLSGYAEGDGSISVRTSTRNHGVSLYITEGDPSRARMLRTIFIRLFGKGYLYHPSGRNYYLVLLNLESNDALNLLQEGFFEHSVQMRQRLTRKAMDSKTIRRLVMLRRTFGFNLFTMRDIKALDADINYTTVIRAVGRGILETAGTQSTHEEGAKWYRNFKFTDLGSDMISHAEL